MAASKRTVQTTRVNGVRVRLTTTTSGTGTKVSVKPAPPQEWELQAAQVRALRSLPEYGKRFLLAGDQNAAKRGRKAQMQAIAAGMTAGEPDVRIYLEGGRLGLIENKVGNGRLSPDQVTRHASLTRLGHPVAVVRANDNADAVRQAVDLVRGWLGIADRRDQAV